MAVTLTDRQVRDFIHNGFVRVAGAVPVEVARRCQDDLWEATGYDRDDPGTWSDTLVRLGAFWTAPFRQAATAPALHEAFDQLVGPGAWVPRIGLGTFPLRFPGPGPAKDAGWHVESSFAGPAGEPRVNLRSRGRALLLLFLFSDVGPDDAPTRVRVGSHLDVPPLLRDHGDDGLEWMRLCQLAVPASRHRAVDLVTGRLGDVYLCHPFLVHAAQAHHGTTPRFMAQPPLDPAHDLDLDTTTPYPVAQAILDALHRP
jgi:hypothetical protein